MTSLNFSLLKWQQEVFKDKTRFKVVAAGRRCGKSRLSAVTLLIEALNCPEGSHVMYVAPTLGQARTIIWDLLHELGRPVIKSSHVNNLEITLINGRKILVRGADNPDSLRGVSLTYLVLDECAFIKEDVWQKILRAALSDRKGRALFISTPSGRNWFYDVFKLGQQDTDEEGWDEEWKSWHFTTRDNETIDPKEIENAEKTLSSFAFKQEYLSSFDNAGSDLFKEDWLKYSDEPAYGSYVIAIDLAGFEQVAKNAGSAKRKLDEHAISIVKIEDNGEWWVKDIIHGRWDIRETAARILMAIRDHQPHGNKKKTDRVVWSLQGRFEHGRIKLNKDKDWKEFVDQYLMFPTAGVHDDLIDSLSYVDQLAITSYIQDYDQDDWEAMDVVAGY